MAKRNIFIILGILVVFFLGMQFERFMYEDTCLDLGGGKNPGNYPICVIQR